MTQFFRLSAIIPARQACEISNGISPPSAGPSRLTSPRQSKTKAVVTKTELPRILGPTQFESELALRTGIPGVATALAYTPVGGELLFIESASMPGKGQLQLTGQIGDVMKESAQAAFSVVKSNAKKLKIDPDRFSKFDYHIHVPAGAIPKDGPSAGVAMFISLVSLLAR